MKKEIDTSVLGRIKQDAPNPGALCAPVMPPGSIKADTRTGRAPEEHSATPQNHQAPVIPPVPKGGYARPPVAALLPPNHGGRMSPHVLPLEAFGPVLGSFASSAPSGPLPPSPARLAFTVELFAAMAAIREAARSNDGDELARVLHAVGLTGKPPTETEGV